MSRPAKKFTAVGLHLWYVEIDGATETLIIHTKRQNLLDCAKKVPQAVEDYMVKTGRRLGSLRSVTYRGYIDA